MEEKLQSRTPLLGLIFSILFALYPIHGDAKVIWENNLSNQKFSFNGYHDVFLNVALFSSALEKTCVNSLEKSLGSRGKLVFLRELDPVTIKAFGQSDVFLDILSIQTKDESILGLKLQARIEAQARKNQFDFSAVIWEKLYLFDTNSSFEQEISKALENSLNEFIDLYFSSNSKAIGNVKFYYPDPSKTFQSSN